MWSERLVFNMKSMIKSELLKQRHTFHKKLIFIAPILTILISFLLMDGAYIQSGAYNWWYMLILPASLTMISSFILVNDKKKKFHYLFTVLIDIKKLWYSKIVISTIYLGLMCLIFFLTLTISGIIFGSNISIFNSLIASILLFILFLWQIPLWMFISMKINIAFSIIFSIICNLGIASIFAIGNRWWIPFSIPAKVMIKVIGIMPNGLLVEENSKLISYNIILICICISIGLFLVLSYFLAKWFENQEV